MEGSKKPYFDASASSFSAGLIIRQKEPRNLESPFDRIDSYLTPAELVLHTQSFSKPGLEPRLLSTTHRWCGEASVCFELRQAAKHAIRNAGRHPGVRG